MRESVSAQRGVALIVALLIVALAAVLIGGLLDRGELALARTRNQLREQQAQDYALGLEAYAAKVLMRAPDQADNADSPWAVPLPPTPVPGGTISAQLSDLNGRFNLNNLDPVNCSTADTWKLRFVNLLQALKLDPRLADDVLAWMQTAQPMSAAAGDGFYLGQNPPYRAAHRDFLHVSELRLIRGVDGEVYAALAPHVSALPSCTKINVNTASVPVLMTLSPIMTAEMAQAIRQQGHARYQSVQEMCKTVPALVNLCNSIAGYDVHSAYFLARGEIVLDDLPFEFVSVIERRLTGSDGGIRVLQRSRGTD